MTYAGTKRFQLVKRNSIHGEYLQLLLRNLLAVAPVAEVHVSARNAPVEQSHAPHSLESLLLRNSALISEALPTDQVP